MDEKVTVQSILNENYCVALIKNSSTIFVFWKFSNYKLSQFRNREINDKILIKVFDSNDNLVCSIGENFETAKTYIVLPRSVDEVYVKMYVINKNSEELIAVSNRVKLSYEKEFREEYNSIK